MKKLILIDGNSLLYRAFFAIRIFTTTDGFPTNALYGLASMLIKILKEKPDYAIAVFDTKDKTFRHEMYNDYKAHRKPPSEELIMQMQPARELIRNFGVTVLELSGYEGDDLIGTISRMASENQIETSIYTGDLDALQLINKNVSVYHTVRGVTDILIYDENAVYNRYGLKPSDMIDYKSLKGDSSDNIPGVPGIGDKTAMTLIKEYGSLEDLYTSIDNMKESKIKKNLIDFKEQAFLSKDLATINSYAPINIDFENILYIGPDFPSLKTTFIKYDFKSLMSFLPQDESILETKITHKFLTPIYIENDKDFYDLKEKMLSSEEVSFYFDMDIKSQKVFSMSVYISTENLYSIPIKHHDFDLGLIVFDEPFAANLSELSDFFSSDKIKKVVYDAKNTYKILCSRNIKLSGICFDIMLGAYLLDPSRTSYEFSDLIFSYIGIKDRKEAKTLYDLKNILYEKLLNTSSLKLHDDLELPLSFVLAEMETCGIELDSPVLRVISEKISQKLVEVTQNIYNISGEDFNIASPKQLSEVLFTKMAIPYPEKGASRSTSADILHMISEEYPIAKEILLYRELTKIKNTYTDNLPLLMDSKTGRLHTTFNQTGTSTGRLSSSNPNIQNIPIRTDLGREIRQAFVSSKDYTLISADYSQVEFRIFAHITGDQWLMDAFNQDLDIHTATAVSLFNVPTEEVTTEMRRDAKTLNFAILYGMADFTLSKQLNSTVKEAKEFIDSYFAKFPKVKETTARIISEAEKNGYVETIFGRRRLIPDINNSNRNIRLAAQRAAVNMPFQGSAADIIKFAMINVSENLKKMGGKILLQVHDELLIEAPDNKIHEAVNVLREDMENSIKLNVPLKTDVKIGKNWYSMEKI